MSKPNRPLRRHPRSSGHWSATPRRIPGGDRGARSATAVRETPRRAARARCTGCGPRARYGLRRPVSVEKILDAEEGRRLAYTVIGGIPVRNYRAEVTLAPVAGGTRIRWAASWDRTLAGRLVQRSLRRVYPQIVADLARAAEKQAAPVRR
jgi:hypothetical protein